MDTRIRPESVLLCRRDELPDHWAAELGKRISNRLDDEECRFLDDRIVGLGHGVQLAHLRSHHVSHPTLGAYKAIAPEGEDEPWLWLVVLVPAGDPSRHLGWMAHLAAGLHDPQLRAKLRGCEQREALIGALQETVHDRHRPVPKSDEPRSAPAQASHRLVIAILKEVEFVDHLLSLFVEYDVRGATVLEARGMAEHLAAHMSLFAGFKSAFRAVGHSQVILTVVPSARCDEVLELVRQAAGGMQTPGSGIAFAVDVPATVGLNKVE